MNVVTEIELRENNLYRNGNVVLFSDGESLLVRDKLELDGELTDHYHILKKNERLDQLAWKYYKATHSDPSKYWWVIADANNIINPLDIESYVGVELLIPNLSKVLVTI